MNIEKVTKNIDYSKTNIGTELECLIINADTFENISRPESQKIFAYLIEKFNWKPRKVTKKNEIHSVEKNIAGETAKIALDVVYSTLEITTINPVGSLEILEKIHEEVLSELRQSLLENNFIIWPFGVAPASTGLLKLPFKKTKEEILDDNVYPTMKLFDILERHAYITSHQVNIDIPFSKMLSAMNAFFKNSGAIIEKFANSAAYFNGTLYKEGRYYWWNDCDPSLHTEGWTFGQTHIFPPQEFKTWNDFFQWIFKGMPFAIRNKKAYIFKDEKTTFHKFFKDRKAIVTNHENDEVKIQLEKDDIEHFLTQFWMDFKPHFDFDSSYTLEEFLNCYQNNDLDAFFNKCCTHSWLEIRPCSPHFEENAMVIPRYFYNIVMNLDQYIEDAKKISWEEARIARDRAIGYVQC